MFDDEHLAYLFKEERGFENASVALTSDKAAFQKHDQTAEDQQVKMNGCMGSFYSFIY